MKKLFSEAVYSTRYSTGSIIKLAVVSGGIGHFAIMHTQYVDLRTLLMLFLVSQVLITARLKSNGLLMPILLHIVMNGTVVALQMAAQTLQPW